MRHGIMQIFVAIDCSAPAVWRGCKDSEKGNPLDESPTLRKQVLLLADPQVVPEVLLRVPIL